MKRVLVSLIAAALVAVPVAPSVAQERTVLDASARASVLFGQIDVQPAFDPAFADSRAAASTIGTTSLQSVAWPSWLVDAFFFLYGFQSVERVGLGIAEARWPQGPEDVDATQSNLLFLNAGDPDDVPGSGGRSIAHASDGRASGRVAWTAVDLAGAGALGAARSETDVRTADLASAEARQVAHDVVVGPLRIDVVRGSAAAASDGTTSATLEVIGAHVAGQDVVIDGEGVRAQTDAAQTVVDDALADSGVSARILPASTDTRDGRSTASSGGLAVLIEREFPDIDGSTVSATLGYVLGAADATARASTVGSLPDLGIDEEVIVFRGPLPCVCAAPEPTVSEPVPMIVRRTVVTTVPVAAAVGARGAYGAIMLLGLALIFIRPLVRAASRT